MIDEEILDDLPEDDAPESDAPEVEAEEAVDPEPTAEPEAPAAPQATVWDAFKALPDFQGMQDDRAIAQRLYQALEREKQASHALAQYQQTMPVVQQYLQNRGPFEQWLASRNQPAPQQQAQQPPQPAEEKWWNPPELRDAYKRYIVKDENGRDAIHPDTPLDARHAINEHFAYKQQFADKFLTNPEEALAPMVARLAQQQAEQIVSSKLEHAGRVQYVSNLEEQNRDWLFDQSGNVSPEGEAARNYIEQAKSLGIASPEQRWDFALQMVERDLLRQVRHAQERQAHQQVFQSHLETAAPPQAAAPAPMPVPQQSQAEANMDYLRRAASRTANRAGASTNSPEMARRGMTFEEQLRHTLEDRGLV